MSWIAGFSCRVCHTSDGLCCQLMVQSQVLNGSMISILPVSNSVLCTVLFAAAIVFMVLSQPFHACVVMLISNHIYSRHINLWCGVVCCAVRALLWELSGVHPLPHNCQGAASMTSLSACFWLLFCLGVSAVITHDQHTLSQPLPI